MLPLRDRGLLHPQDISCDFRETVAEYYQLFCECEQMEEMYQSPIAGAVPETKQFHVLQIIASDFVQHFSQNLGLFLDFL